MTRRQRQIVALLDAGYVAELRRPRRPNDESRLYIMRAPRSTETDGEIVTSKVIDTIVASGHAVRIKMPWSGKTWVYSRECYEKSQMGTMVTAR